MKKASLKKLVSAVAVAVTITTLLPLGVSAQWRQNTDSTWSYMEENTMANGWKTISDTWYYFNSNGKMNTGWICDNGTWYYNNNSGAMEKGWIKDNETWYYLDNTGAMKTGWIKDDGKWYYLDSAGAMQTEIIKTNINSNQESSGTVNINTNVDVNELPTQPQNYAISVQADAENKILELMNQKRTEAGLKPLAMDNTLLQVSRYKSNHMIQYNYFDHTNPDGVKWTDWLKAIGYEYTTTGENIAYNTYDAVELFNQWWNSSGHRANMMNSSYTKVGVGVISGNDKYMGTQEFSN